ncbi:hypothetical protein F5Y18DRAFT_70313 [Xylariaceae sp. FL1019]|nr:hypothetical protein F5Y18DRAFT_70313 [Xylariaceae sp. FL1019]
MEAAAVIKSVASLDKFSRTTILLHQNIGQGRSNVDSTFEEIALMQSIFNDSKAMVERQRVVPESVSSCIALCHRQQVHFLENIARLLSISRGHGMKTIFKAHRSKKYKSETMVSYHSFRASVLMLRDMTADLTSNQQMTEISTTMALLLSESKSPHPLEQRENEAPVTERNALPATDRSRNSNPLLMEFMSLMHFDFIRDIMLIIEVEGREGPDKFKYIPLRNKIDTASDENFVSRKILERHKMDMSRVTLIPDADRRERTLEGLGGDFVPEAEITLQWHKLRDRQQREGVFIIIDDPPFDILIGSKQFASESNPSVMWGFRRKKAQTEREAQRNHDANRRTAEEDVKAQLTEAQAVDKDSANAGDNQPLRHLSEAEVHIRTQEVVASTKLSSF